jgi:hypothetical protein
MGNATQASAVKLVVRKKRKHTMKVVFTINTLVAALINALAVKIDQRKVEQACESYRNGLRVQFRENPETGELESTEKSARAMRIAGSKSKGFHSQERMAYSVTRIGDLQGESNVVARFIAYNDEMTLLEKRASKIETKLAPVVIPAEFSYWLTKFAVKTEAPKAPEVPATVSPEAPKASNGKAKSEKNRLVPA